MTLTAQEQQILLSEKEAAAVMRVSIRTLFNMRKAGELHFVRAGARILYRRSALEAWAEANEVQGS